MYRRYGFSYRQRKDGVYASIRVGWNGNYPNGISSEGVRWNRKLAEETFLLLEEHIKLAENRYFESETLDKK